MEMRAAPRTKWLTLAWLIGGAGCSDDNATSGTEAPTSSATQAATAETTPTTSEPTSTSTLGETHTGTTSTSTSTSEPGTSTTTEPGTSTTPATSEPETATGPGRLCGDGQQDDGEECDDGNDDDTDACLTTCLAAECGDGAVHVGVEECDDGDAEDTDACLATCKTAKCGDGTVQAGVEECDDGNMNDADACNNSCTSSVRIVFVTSIAYSGNLGGLAGADAKCNQRAAAAGLPGTYMAWLSDDTGSPATRMTKSATPYVLPNGVKIANDWNDLTDSSLLAPIAVNELGGPVSTTNICGPNVATVFTNTLPDGTQINSQGNCANWTGGNGPSNYGFATSINGFWTFNCIRGIGSCSDPAFMSPIYCFQQ